DTSSSMRNTFPGGRAVMEEAFRIEGLPRRDYSSNHGIDNRKYYQAIQFKFKAMVDLLGGPYSKVVNTTHQKRFFICNTKLCKISSCTDMLRVKNLRPNASRYDYTWDPTIVLNYLSKMVPNESLSLKELSYKLITLLALITSP
ncbi:hypothetical protein NQ315_006109, partial [Exocentrus adspersus]